MSDIEITPEVLRAVAGLFDLEDSKPEFVSTALREKAVLLERKQADEKRVHELAQVFFRAAHPTATPWDSQPEGVIRTYLDGMRAVLAKLEQGREQPLRRWEHLHDIPKDVQKVRNGDGRECVREQLVWKLIHPDDGKPLTRWHSRGPFTEVIDQ